MNFNQLIAKIEADSTSTRDKGDRLEIPILSYLKTDKSYSEDIVDIWLWNQFEYRDQFGGGDTGVDLVAKTKDGWWAIQCKYRQQEKISRQGGNRQLYSYIR